jgi:hypothetical protein
MIAQRVPTSGMITTSIRQLTLQPIEDVTA